MWIVDHAISLLGTGSIGAVARMVDRYFKYRTDQQTQAHALLQTAMDEARVAKASEADSRRELDTWKGRYYKLEHANNNIVAAMKELIGGIRVLAQSPHTDPHIADGLHKAAEAAQTELNKRPPRSIEIDLSKPVPPEEELLA